jgi:MFS family permease
LSSKSTIDDKSKLSFRNVVMLGYVSLFTDLSTEMILGVLPLFIVVDLGASAAVLGLIEGVAEAVNYSFRVLAGVLSDRIGRRKSLVLLGYSLSSFAKPLFALTASWGQAFAVRVVDRAGKGTRTSPRDALISDSVSRSESGKAFGTHRSMDQIGAVAGPLLAFALVPLIGIRGLFWISFIPALVALMILLFFVKEKEGLKRQRNVFENARAVFTRDFALLLVVLGVFSVGAYDFSFILLEASAFGVQAYYIPLVYAFLNLATVMIGLPIGLLADRIGKIPVLCFGYSLFLLTSLVAVFVGANPLNALVIAFLFGSYLSVSETVQRALIPDFTKPEFKGTAYALYYTLVGACALVANSIFGALWSSKGSAFAFQYSMITSAFGLAALLFFMIKKWRIVGPFSEATSR